MVQVNLTQGAKLASVSRSTLNRHIKKGKISKVTGKDGKPRVDTSELQRAYGQLSHDTSSQSVSVKRSGTPHNTIEKAVEIASLKAELHATKERLEDARQDRDEWKGQAETLSALLTDQHPPVPEPVRKGLLGRLARIYHR